MKRNALSILGLMAMFFFVACGGGEEAAAENTDNGDDAAMTEEVAEVTYTIDPANSVVKWKGTMIGVKFHTGTLNFTEGMVKAKGDQITGAKLAVDMTSMVTTDDNYQPEEGYGSDKLIGHLSSPDFFDVENNPVASFTMKEGNTGSLMVRGKTNDETVEITSVKVEGDKIMATGTLTFDRQKYDVAWENPMKEMVLSDDIELEIEITGTAQ